MRRVALLLGACLVAACVPHRVPHLAPDHHVRVLWVHDSVMQQLQAAANDSSESMWEITEVATGQICPAAVTGLSSCHYGTPLDSGYLVLGIVACPTQSATSFVVHATCPNPFAPTIHIHPHTGSGFDAAGNNCSPSPADYAFQLWGRHLFDAIICGPNTRPSAYWYYNNPLLGTAAFPDTIGPMIGVVLPRL